MSKSKLLSLIQKSWADIVKEDEQIQTLLLSQQKILQQIEDLKNQKIVASSSSKPKQIVLANQKLTKIVHPYIQKPKAQFVIQMEVEFWDENPEKVFQKNFPKNISREY